MRYFSTLAPALLLGLAACSGDPAPGDSRPPSSEVTADSLPAALARVERLAANGEAGRALVLTDSLLARFPNSIDALLLKGALLEGEGRPEEALPVLQQAYAISPGDGEVAHRLAFAYAEGKDERALALSDSLIRADVRATHGEPYYFKGVYYANTGKTGEAVQHFDEAIRHDYNFIDAYMDKGRLQLESGDAAAALATFTLAARVQPAFADAYHWMGRSLDALGRKGEAEEQYARAKRLEAVGSKQ